MSKGRRSIRNRQKKHVASNDTTTKNEKCSNPTSDMGGPDVDGMILTKIPTNGNFDLNLIFRTDEMHALRKQIEPKDMIDMPILVGAVILGKIEMVKKLLKEGHNVNECGVDQTSPLMWAVKNKNMEMIDLLIYRGGADATFTDKNGDNAILLAMDSSHWNELGFLEFWNGIVRKKLTPSHNHTPYDINYANKAGNTMLHFAIKRQWPQLVQLLIANKVNVNCTNSKGVTPLMMAGARNNGALLELLLNSNADMTREDDRGCTVLCYVIAYIIQKRIEPSTSMALEKLVNLLNNDDFELTAEEYLRRRLELIVTRRSTTFPHIIITIILPIFTFFIRHTKHGLEVLLDLNVFGKLKEAVDKHFDSIEYVNTVLMCGFELVRYCHCCTGAGLTEISEQQLMDQFVLNNGGDMCLTILKRYAPEHSWILVSALMPLFIACVADGQARIWLQLHYREILPFYQQFLSMCVVSFNFIADDYHIKLVKRKIRLFKTLIRKLESDESGLNAVTLNKVKGLLKPLPLPPLATVQKCKMFKVDADDVGEVERKLVTLDEFLPGAMVVNQQIDGVAVGQKLEKINSKRMKRKTKAWKAKVAKIRSADVAERVISKDVEGKKFDDQDKSVVTVTDDSMNWAIESKHEEQELSPSVSLKIGGDTIKTDDKLDQESSSDEIVSEEDDEHHLDDRQDHHEHDQHHFHSHHENMSVDTNVDDVVDFVGDVSGSGVGGYFNEDIEKTLRPKLEYLSRIFEDVVARYERNWKMDRELGYPNFQAGQGDGTYERVLTGTREEQVAKLSEILPELEASYMSRLRNKFNETLLRIKEIAYNHDPIYLKLLEHTQLVLLNHEIRGETVITNNGATSYEEWSNGTHKDVEDEYMKEIVNITNRQLPEVNLEEVEAVKQKTEESAYHLIDSVERLLDSSSVSSSCENFDLFPYSNDALQMEEKPKEIIGNGKLHFFNILNGKGNRRGGNKGDEEVVASTSTSVVRYQSTPMFWKKVQVNQQLSPTPPPPPSPPPGGVPGQQLYVSRWDAAIQNLRGVKNLTTLACGELRTSLPISRIHFMVSSGGNFGDVELGLDIHGRALAVKRIPKQNNIVCKILKNAMNPLLGLRHKHLLHYAICDYDEAQLMVASPLCEYNMGEYLMCLKINHSLLTTASSLARQMLIGLRYLHERSVPIVHGNLKPSNVLIDSTGILKLAEFGVYRALYQTVRPPKSSIIWFARETYEHYEKTSIMSCTTYSDIQVGGMLLHFILTGGLHPFGIVAEDILENIVRGAPDLKTVGCELVDLVSWMLIYEPTERPNVGQVLSHVYFWDSERKWRFLLACAGVTPLGSPIPVSLTHLHATLDESAARDHIKGDWVTVVKSKFPGMRLPEGTFSDTPTGLLRFLRACTEERQLNSRSFGGIDLQTFFIEAFPALPLSLFRLLETSEWLKHPVFQMFTVATS